MLVNKEIIDKKLFGDLKNYKIEEIIALKPLFISLSLYLISKYNKS